MSRWERWSQRKRGVESDDVSPLERDDIHTRADVAQVDDLPRNDGQPDHEQRRVTKPADPAASPAAAEVPPPGSLDETLPDPESLPPGSDFSIFMASGVSKALRRRALKRLWATGNYNVRDGLDDYDADYRQQLKPMASELAGKLRRWTHKAEETLKTPESEKERESANPASESQDVNVCTQPKNPIEETVYTESIDANVVDKQSTASESQREKEIYIKNKR